MFNLIIFALIALLMVAFVVAITVAHRKVPVQYAKRVVGRKMYGGHTSYIPLKVNQAGVIPIIFASSVLMFPVTIAQFVKVPWVQTIAGYFAWGTPLQTTIYILMIIFFTYFYTAVSMQPIIEVKNLVHVYTDGQNNNIKALDSINLSIAPGEFVAIIGTNGSGKSTLARHFNGLLQPTSGKCFVNGLDTTIEGNTWNVRQTIGMVFQNPDNQIVAAIVEEDVAFGPENIGVPHGKS